MSQSSRIHIGSEEYSFVLQQNTIELQHIPKVPPVESPTEVTHSVSADTVLLHIHSNKKPLGTKFIAQQNSSILNRAHASNLLYLWIGFQNSLDLVYFGLPSEAKVRSESVGQSVLSFSFNNERIGNLSLIQV